MYRPQFNGPIQWARGGVGPSATAHPNDVDAMTSTIVKSCLFSFTALFFAAPYVSRHFISMREDLDMYLHGYMDSPVT